MKEYKIAKGWAIFIYIFAPLLIGLFGWVLTLPFANGSFSPNASWILIPIAIAMIALMVYGVIDAYKGKLTIYEDRIVSISTFSNRELKYTDIKGFTSLALFLFAYSFGTVIHLNCYYDNSEAEYFTAKVLNKRISSGKTTKRYLELSTWGQQKKVDEVSVGKDFYNRTEIGDEVNIFFKKGKLEIPWFIFTDE